MTTLTLDPALWQLLRYQSVAKVRRLGRSFTTPRKLFLSTIAVLLGMLWLGNATWSVLVREPLAPSLLQESIPAILLFYALWHGFKVIYRRPEEGIEWTAAEREFVCVRPFRRRDLLAYRFASIATPEMLKASCFTFLMLPDLACPAAAWVGVWLALTFLDFLRMLVEITACGVSLSVYRRCHWCALLLISVALASMITMTVCRPWSAGEVTQLSLLWELIASASVLRETRVGVLLEAPFKVFIQVMLAASWSPATIGFAGLAMLMVGATAGLVIRLDGVFHSLLVRREFLAYQDLRQSGRPTEVRTAGSVHLPWVPSLRGAGPIAWRQFLGAANYLGSLLLALITPGILSCLPLMVIHDPTKATINVVGALTFYSFLLLPSALKFDFRRDLDRLLILKGLPLRPRTVVLGQLLTPVAIASALQWVVIGVTFLVYPSEARLLCVAAALLLPLNVLIYALENILFLCYPHRLKQEGIEVFLRATLTFTAKGVIFSLGVAAVYIWAVVSKSLLQMTGLADAWPVSGPLVFVGGLWAMLLAASVAAIAALVGAYCRFDSCQDSV